MTKQAREAQAPSLEWVKPHVWTRRMLDALDKGVKGGKWFSLIDKVYATQSLTQAWKEVWRNRGCAGVDRESVATFAKGSEKRLERLANEIKGKRYSPQAVKRIWIPKPSGGQRPLGIPTVRDRVVQTALKYVLEPIFERDFSEHSYGFRPGRGAKDALRRVDTQLRQGYSYVVDADLKSYFDTIPHDRLMELVETKVADRQILQLIQNFLQQGVLEEGKEWQPDGGTPQGGVVSPLLANIYLDPLDKLMEENGFQITRYADDFVVLCKSQQDAEHALRIIQQWTQEVGLTLHPEKTHIVDIPQGGSFEFLGYRFKWNRRKRRPLRLVRQDSLKRLRNNIRKETKRCNTVLRGWFAYFQQAHWTEHRELDKWVRMRLRSILRKRSKRKGRGRGRDHNRWPINFFTEQGLFTLNEAHCTVIRSHSGN